MKTSSLYLIAASFFTFGLVVAQSSVSTNITQLVEDLQATVPICAFNCIVQGVTESTCDITNNTCICTNPSLAVQLEICLVGNCTVIEQLATAKYQKTNCGAPVRNSGPELEATVWSLFSLSAFSVICRLIARLPYVGGTYNFSYDDYIIISSFAGMTATSVIAQKLVNSGMGQDIWMLNSTEITNTLFYFFLAEYLYSFVIVATKIAIVCLYLRIFPKRSFHIQCYILIILSCCQLIGSVVSNGFYCKPITYVWQGWDGEHKGHCPVDVNAQTYSLGSINIAVDLLIFIAPIPQLMSLQMSLKKKLGIALMFLVGIIVTICSIIRMWTITIWGKSTDPTYDYASLARWSVIELNVGIICACMPGMAALIRRLVPQVFGTIKKTSRNASKDIKEYGSSTKFSRGSGPRDYQISKTTDVSVSYVNSRDSKDDEFELLSQKASSATLRQAPTPKHTDW